MNPSSEQPDAGDVANAAAAREFTPLRTWPAIGLLMGMLATRYLPKLAEAETMALLLVMVLGPLLLGILILIWWLTFSRATRAERWIGFLGALAAAAVAIGLSDKSVMGPALMLITFPMGTAAFGIAAILFSRVLSFRRTSAAILLAACGFGFTALIQSHGMWGNGKIDWQWRWQTTPEQAMLATRSDSTKESTPLVDTGEWDAWLVDPAWPRFRGADGLSQQYGPKIDVDWESHPPQEVWRRPIGPGWSSFVVAGNLLFTQEQHGDDEAVVCYAADSGQELWTHTIESRFSDPLGGPGPRATPTLADGALFAQGANGQLQRLDPKTGNLVWQQDIRELADREPPQWGFSSSPLVVGSVVIVHAGGTGDKGTLAFDIASGELKWSAAAGDHSYSSPQLGILAGATSVLMVTNDGLNVLDPVSGEERLEYAWPFQGYRVLQPPVIDGDAVLVATQELGTARIRIQRQESESEEAEPGGQLVAEQVWISRHLKPDFNDFVIYDGHAFGFDGMMFTCIDLETGKRKWKKGRYGKGQVLLLSASGLLLVQSESGEIILIPADATAHQELAKVPVLDGRTWNHPVVVGDRLYVRNSTEAACFRLPLAPE